MTGVQTCALPIYRDFPVIIAVNMVFAVVIVFSNLAVDLTYAVVDPRIKFS